MIDHGTRALISLRHVRVRTSPSVLRVILDAVEHCGARNFLRTDNEPVFASPVFASPLFSVGLGLIGIRHQRTDRSCPWQNGGVERVFLTLKDRVARWWDEAGAPDEPQNDLDTVRTWFNHVRPHQALRGRPPAESWAPSRSGSLQFFSAWGGPLSGYGRPT